MSLSGRNRGCGWRTARRWWPVMAEIGSTSGWATSVSFCQVWGSDVCSAWIVTNCWRARYGCCCWRCWSPLPARSLADEDSYFPGCFWTVKTSEFNSGFYRPHLHPRHLICLHHRDNTHMWWKRRRSETVSLTGINLAIWRHGWPSNTLSRENMFPSRAATCLWGVCMFSPGTSASSHSLKAWWIGELVNLWCDELTGWVRLVACLWMSWQIIQSVSKAPGTGFSPTGTPLGEKR